MEVNRADYETLLRIPGIGMRSAGRIVATRRVAPVRIEDLAPLGVVTRRALHFVTCNGRYAGAAGGDPVRLRALLQASASRSDGTVAAQGLLPLVFNG